MVHRRAIYIGALVLCYTPKVQGLADYPDTLERSVAYENQRGYSYKFTQLHNLIEGQPAGKGPPAAPALSAAVVDESMVLLQWEKRDSAATYSIYRSMNQEMPALLHKIGLGEPALHTDSAVLQGNSYTYYVKATDPVQGLASWSPAARVTLEVKKETVQFEDIRNDTASHRLYFRWNKPASKIISYRIQVTRKGKTSTLCRVDGETHEVVCRYEGEMRGAVFTLEPIEIR